MALEDLTGSDKYIDDLVETNPVGSKDTKSTLDDHITGIKNVLKNCFAGITGAVTATHTELNTLDGITSSTAELNLLDGASGIILQTVEATPYTTYSSHTTIIPQDDTIPQNTEGEEIITVSITPTSATNRLKITCNADYLFAGNGTADYPAMALFQDTTANALAAAYSAQELGTQLTLIHEMAAGTTSATTFKIRMGPPNAGTLYINGTSGNRIFGGISAVRLRVEEIA